jgi:asparagine N-glycosylation enzyme membrane subunit Stt3
MKLGRTALAGVGGTAIMTMLMLAAPLMGLPKMPIGEMLGSFLKIGSTLGWAMHGMIGLVLAAFYAAVLSGRLPGAPALRGAVFGVLVFLVAQLAVMPMMGAGVFSGGNIPMIMGSLVGHLVFGGVVGGVYGSARLVPATA